MQQLLLILVSWPADRSVGRKKEDPQPNPPTPNPLKKKEKEGGKRWVVLSDPTTTTPLLYFLLLFPIHQKI